MKSPVPYHIRKQDEERKFIMNNIKRRVTSVLVAAVTVLSVGAASVGVGTLGILPDLSISASAATEVSYVNAKGADKTVSSYAKIKSSTTKLNGGWYVVDGKYTIDDRITVTDDSYIIITDGSRLTVKGGIEVASGVKFNVYTQDGGTGTLYAGTTTGSNITAGRGDCGIGGKGAYVNLVGGNIYARGGSGSYGIQGKEIHLYWTNPTDSIYASSYNGTVDLISAFADKRSGSAYYNSTVSASALEGVTLHAAKVIDRNTTELEDGNYASFDKVTVPDRITVKGDVSLYLAHNSTLRADEGITVSRGDTLNIYGNGGRLYAGTTNGSNFTAMDNCSAIGSENGDRAGTININSGVVYANGGRNAAGIGGNAATVEIDGGTVSANGGRYGAGIGSGYNDNGADVMILGGNVTATGGNNAAGIGSGYYASQSNITLSYTYNTDSVYASSYNGNIKFLKTFYTTNGETATARNIANTKLTPTASMFTVDFETNGAGYLSSQTVIAGRSINLPTPVKQGYVFDGWYTDRNFRYRFYNNTAVTQNLTLYAKWSEGSYTIYYVTNGGTAVASRKVASGKPIGASELTYRAGYEFTGWYTDKNCYYPVNIESIVTSDITLYAGWRQTATYTVTYDSNGGNYIAPITVEANSLIGRNEPTPRRDGYLFDGWYTDTNFRYKFDSMTTRINQNYTLYAKWEKYNVTYTILFNSNGGSSVGNMTVSEGDTVSQTDLPFPTRAGYTFNGWYEDAACNNYSSRYTINSDKVLYAGWSQDAPQTYTISFNSNGGSSVGSMTVDAGDAVPQTALPFPTRAGYTFNGWYEDAACNLYSSQYSINSNITLYAGWSEDAPVITYYTVTFRADGGLYTSETVEAGGSAWDPGVPRDPDTWDGWYDQYDNYYSFGTPVNSDIILYAKWYAPETGSTFGGAGLIAAIVGGVVVVGGGIAGGIAISKKKKK